MNRIRLEFSVYYLVDDSIHSAIITNDGFECITLPTLDEVYDPTITQLKIKGKRATPLEKLISFLLSGAVDIQTFIETLEERGFDTELLSSLINSNYYDYGIKLYDWLVTASQNCVIFKDLKSFEAWEEIALDLETFEYWDIIPVGEKVLTLREELA